MTVFSTLQAFANRYRAYRRATLTEQMIGSLPYDVRKDIGWPPAKPARAERQSAYPS